MTKSIPRWPSLPYVEYLEKREQPGSIITAGFEPSLLARSLLSHGLGTVFDEPVAARVMTPISAGVVNSVDSGENIRPPLPQSDLEVSVSIPTNSAVPGLQGVFGHGAPRSDPRPTLGPGMGMERPGDVGTRGPDLRFYGGDFKPGDTGLSNEYNTFQSDARTYDGVRARSAWKMDCLFSHNLMSFTGVQQAYVHVLGPGKFQAGKEKGGLPDAYPRTLHSATQTFYSDGDFGYTEYEIKVCGQGLQLPQGHYYFNVQPVGFGTARSYGATSHGLNGKGSPLYNDDSWFHNPSSGYHWVDTNVIFGGKHNWDFSQGICSRAGLLATSWVNPSREELEMTKSIVRRRGRPQVEGLEKREQPGSIITAVLEPPLLASSFLSPGLLSVFDEPVASRAMTPPGRVNSVESEDIIRRPLPHSDLDVSVFTPRNPAVLTLQDVSGLGVMRTFTGPTIGPGPTIERPTNAGTRGPNLHFYGGDFDGNMDDTGLVNEYNTIVSDARTYDGVRIRGAWKMDCLFSHNLMSFTGAQTSYVHIIGPGKVQEGVPNGGLADAYPRTLHPATQTFYSSGGLGYLEYEIKVCGLGLQLPQGHYYFNVQPVGFGTGRSFGATTHGLNGKGSPIYNDDSWFHAPDYGYHWVDTEEFLCCGVNWDFSQGICSAPAC